MFNAQQIKQLVEAHPFKSFRICMSDGKTFDITNHDAALVKRNWVEVGLDLDPHGIAADFDRCAIIHITRIEDLAVTESKN